MLCIVLRLHQRFFLLLLWCIWVRALAILWWQSGRQRVSVGRRSGGPPKTSPSLASGCCDQWWGIRWVPPAPSQKGLRCVSTPTGLCQIGTPVNQREQCDQEGIRGRGRRIV